MGSTTRTAAFGVLAFALTLLLFREAGGFGLINCDDYDYLLAHGEVVGG